MGHLHHPQTPPNPAQPSGQICVQLGETELGGNEGPLLRWTNRVPVEQPFPRGPRQDQMGPLQKAVESSAPIEQMERLRFLLGGVPAHPEPYLRQFLGQGDSQPQPGPPLPQAGMEAAL